MGAILKPYIAMAGLIALIPIGYLLVTGRVSVTDAGIRGGLVIVSVFVLRNLVGRIDRSASRNAHRNTADRTTVA